MSKTVQLELPEFGAVASIEPIKGTNREIAWYYLVKPRTCEMMAIDEQGRYIWIPHDTIRLVAHLFNTRNLAIIEKRKHKYAVVRRWKWRVET